MIKKIAGVLILTGVVLLFNSCYNNKEELLYGTFNCNGAHTSFSADVFPIIQANCANSCHGTGSTNGPGPLTTYEQIKNAAQRIKPAVVSRYMPKVGSLTTSQIKSISCWVDAGAPNN
ncbi:cytochrome c [Niastella caeni]|uniref:Cytochrome c n=1 Tax=Niastella caeni TaxID=2569763 RepID=A0A4S8HT86_9BACT|nr:cytochrome c [Niastella caeni]THU37194.1 cytochrome c [Niastella caeni]